MLPRGLKRKAKGVDIIKKATTPNEQHVGNGYICLITVSILLGYVLPAFPADIQTLADVTQLIKQRKGKAARNIIDRHLTRAGQDPETLFQLYALRMQSFLVDPVVNIESMTEAHDSTHIFFMRLSKDQQNKHETSLAKLDDFITRKAYSQFLEAISLESKGNGLRASILIDNTNKTMKKYIDDMGALASDLAVARLSLTASSPNIAIRNFEDLIKNAEKLIQKYNDTPREAQLQSMIHLAYRSVALAHIRDGNIDKAKKVKAILSSLIDTASTAELDNWFDTQMLSHELKTTVWPTLEPIFKRTIEAITSNNVRDLQALMLPTSLQYAEIQKWTLLEIAGDSSPQFGSRLVAKFFAKKYVGGRKRIYPYTISTGIMIVIFQHDGVDWKIHLFGLRAPHFKAYSVFKVYSVFKG